MTWDFHTLQGPEQITNFIESSSEDKRIIIISLDKSATHKMPQVASFGHLKVVQAFLNIETSIGRGVGLVRLISDIDDGGRWKAFTLFTTLQQIKGYEEDILNRRPRGADGDFEDGSQDWKDRLVAQQNFEGGSEPTILILGAGQSGLTVAARLKQLGLETLIIDKNPRIGDNWRKRYRQLVFTPKDKLADWFEYYAGVFELNVWTSSTVETSKWSESTRQWTVTLVREENGQKDLRTLHPRHIVLATGQSGEPYLPSNISGLDDFKGDRLVHSSQFVEPTENANGKKAVIIGCCNSGHDIARDYHDHGYNVTMVQRSSTLVLTSDSFHDVSMKGLYAEDGPPVEDADILNMSISNPIAKRLQIATTSEMMRRDSTLLQGLASAGFAIDSGPDGSGLMMKYLSRGGGYYIDTGASQLIADKKIKIKQGHEVRAIKAHSLVLADGSELEADEIVFATGYQNMRETARKLFGNELADRVHDVWGFDDQGETRGMWRRSGHPGFWFFGGNLALCRFYSRLLALQIKAIETGLMEAW
ncbi:hypothetical protein IMSHALPRED_008534 [Imshaugia aleurites]|uniref:FAD/NAD(P)-binding domain-containing protein n=1 Tax=Imshaugia aleurites TaxID=172621 RepID=A0A8H3EMQ2_9LECA|nr:hypothetical protein IMSHALPRED_008534 [Imshaugia aleurites]